MNVTVQPALEEKVGARRQEQGFGVGARLFQSLNQVKNRFLEDGQANLQGFRRHGLLSTRPESSRQGETDGETDWTFSILYLIGLFLLALLIVFIQGFFVKILWNFVIPPLFGLNKVNRLTWLTAVSLLVLTRILFF
jgi:hypothetical protein